MSLFGDTTGYPDLELLCEKVQVISMRVGKAIREQRKSFRASDIEEKDFNNLVSFVDRAAEDELVKQLSGIFPEAGFITEENADRPRGKRFNWIIDPLDGTTNFIHGIPCYAVSVALADGMKPILGVIYEVNMDECFYAWKDGGAFLNGERIRVSATKELKRALIGTGFPYVEAGLHEKYVALFGELQRSSRGIRRPGSAATDMAWTAAGRFDAFYEYGLAPWDVAAGIILVLEAGGECTDFSNEDGMIARKELLCGTPAIHAALLPVIHKHFSQ
jgi:myo-inositol-1(or 4)-monophosphatase